MKKKWSILDERFPWSLPILGDFFFNFNIFLKLILNLTWSIFFKLTLLAAPIALARPNACAAPYMVARHRADVTVTGFADR